MAEVTLVAETGRPTGSRPAKRLRAEGRIPGVVYGSGIEPTPVAVAWKELRAALTTDAGLNALIDLDVGSDNHLTLVKELQRHPVRRDVVHVDFVVIDRDTAVEVEVPVILTGEMSEELGQIGAVVDQQIHALPISAKPGRIPNEVEVDISGITLDEPVRVSDVRLPDGVEATVEGEEPIATASVPQVEIPEPDEEELEAEGEAGEAVEAAEEGEAGAEAADEVPADEGA